MGGWGIIAADVIVMANLAQMAGSYSFTFVGQLGLPGMAELADSTLWSTVAGLAWIAIMTYICYRGIEISARLQYVLLSIEVVVLLVFAGFALTRVYTGTAESYSLIPSLDWFNPFTLDFGSVIAPAMLIAIFIYWGWATAVSVNEESDDPAKTPGRAAFLSTVLLLATSGAVTVATKAQVRHAERHARRLIEATIDGAMRADARAFNRRQPKNSYISMSMKVGGSPAFTPHRVPAAASAAMELEISCEKCSCRFAVIGSAYFCPACRHSSVDRMFDDSLRKIRAKKDNVDVVRDAIAASAGRDEAELMCRSLIESCLQDGVTAFQRCCEGLYASTGPATPAPMNAFQRLAQGSEHLPRPGRLWGGRG